MARAQSKPDPTTADAGRLAPRYDPLDMEQEIYAEWLRRGYFHQEVDPSRKPFCIVIPPPNVTGSLHIGHALDNTLQDILVRWHRMMGDNTVWIPGTDHAGIATQVKVEAALAKEGLSRHDLGREEFVRRVWQWKEKYGGTIRSQLQRLGASCDWERERFTMDEGLSRAVRQVFVRLYEKGLIYRGTYIINWCPRCRTSLSDLEVEHEDSKGTLYYIKYPLTKPSGGDGHVTVATTRPETMLGDTAVAVNPRDPRYARLIGAKVVLPIMGREIPIIADDHADPEFGTGAVKVTPAHDPNDFEIGLRHGLPAVKVIGEDGRMTKEAGKYEGLDRYDCRGKVVEELACLGLLEKVEPHDYAVGHCQRCNSVVEPMISRQWFVKMKPLAGPALEAVRDGRLRFVPERFAKVYLNWMENVHDWCISRQLWWGHRIPVWYCGECGEASASAEDLTRCPKCGSTSLEQDPDVLDTWFSSALWPFSTMGWPEATPELRHLYPTSVLVTAYDIIFFWVARMIFMGLEFMGNVPFRDVFIHGLVRAASGKKMSKSLGTGVDPLEVVDRCGADVLRFTLVSGNTPGNDMRFREERLEASRNFANKLWNAARFVLMNLGDFDPANVDERALRLLPADRWIRSRVNRVAQEVDSHLRSYEVGEAARALYDFTWDEFCDWYIEISKARLYGSDDLARSTARFVLWETLGKVLRLLHPFMPFITEGIWRRLPGTSGSVMVSAWPTFEERLDDPDAEAEMVTIMSVTRAIRSIRSEMNVPAQKKVAAVAVAEGRTAQALQTGRDLVMRLAGLERLRVEKELEHKPEKAAHAVVAGVEVYVPLGGIIDLESEIRRLERDMRAAEAALEAAERKLSNPGFLEKASEEVIDRERARRGEYAEKRERLAALLQDLRA
ncbi:MAG: valine--tRNA ligase [Firmicutes bacterium]|nr:valine--tRNA ligase [Bacillota bacterium]MDH7494947.1 valine--tRNA ligase [Bacillota bacterium]